MRTSWICGASGAFPLRLCRPLALFFTDDLPQTDTKPLRKSGKKHTSPPSSARSSILMTRRTFSRLIVD